MIQLIVLLKKLHGMCNGDKGEETTIFSRYRILGSFKADRETFPFDIL